MVNCSLTRQQRQQQVQFYSCGRLGWAWGKKLAISDNTHTCTMALWGASTHLSTLPASARFKINSQSKTQSTPCCCGCRCLNEQVGFDTARTVEIDYFQCLGNNTSTKMEKTIAINCCCWSGSSAITIGVFFLPTVKMTAKMYRKK